VDLREPSGSGSSSLRPALAMTPRLTAPPDDFLVTDP
jgi:hypothetical protein